MAITTMRIKTLLLLTLAFFINSLLSAQNYKRPENLPAYDFKKWHFGFTVGPEFQNMHISNSSANVIDLLDQADIPQGSDAIYYYSEMTGLSTGFNVGIITSRRLGEYFNLRMIPSLSLGQKTVQSNKYYHKRELKQDINTAPISTKIKSTYISLPVLIKYKAARIQDMRPYLISGINLKYDLATDDNEAISLKTFDTAIEVGLGADFYLQAFRLGVELRLGLGLSNILQTDRPVNIDHPYLTPSIQQIKAKTFTIAFNFE